MDLRSELTFRKFQAQVLGLTRGEGIENTAVEFLSVVKRVSSRRDAELLAEPATVDALPVASQREDLQAVRLEREEPDPLDDPDDLAEWDAENRAG